MSAKRVVILQSNYIPWKGYFDLIQDADECIFLEDVQYTPQNWRNRNRIKTAAGPKWLSIPVGASKSRLLCEVELPRFRWADRHWSALVSAYGRAPYFHDYGDLAHDALFDPSLRMLSELNQHLITVISTQVLGITTRFRDSREFRVRDHGKQERLLEILEQAGGGVYVSGPAAKAFLDPRRFASHGIEVVWKDYCGYPEYDQLYPPFRHDVTILDLLFHVGGDAPDYIWGWRSRAS
jgi:WbqC-like protein family